MPFEVILKYGVPGICLAALVVTVALVRLELKRTKPRAAGISLIALTMLFCFMLIGGSAYIEERSRANSDLSQKAKAEVREAAVSIDAYLYDKLQNILNKEYKDFSMMRNATVSICHSVRNILNSTGNDQRARCKVEIFD